MPTKSTLTMTVASKKERLAERDGSPARCWSLQLTGEIAAKGAVHPVALTLLTYDAAEAAKYQAGEPVKVALALTPTTGAV